MCFLNNRFVGVIKVTPTKRLFRWDKHIGKTLKEMCETYNSHVDKQSLFFFIAHKRLKTF